MSRYSSRALPSVAYVPGTSPRADRPRDRHAPGDRDTLATDDDFRHGVDLFNHGFPWEAHEAWEPLWRATPRDHPERALLHGLIHAAAALIKAKAGTPAIARGFVARARRALADAPTTIGATIVELPGFVAALIAWAEDPTRPPPTITLG